MINLIPLDQKNYLKRAYRTRLAIVIGILLAVLLSICLVLTASRYIMMTVRESSLSGQLEAIKKTEAGQKLAGIQAQVGLANKASKLVQANKPADVSGILARLLHLASGKIAVEKIEYDPIKKTAILGGVAASRRDLVAFIEELRRHELVAKVEAPLSDVISQGNNSFTINLTLK
jgi:hypothetical protein